MLNRRGPNNDKVPTIFFKLKLKIKPLGNLPQVRPINCLIILLTDLYGFFPHVQYLYHTSLRSLLNSSCQCCWTVEGLIFLIAPSWNIWFLDSIILVRRLFNHLAPPGKTLFHFYLIFIPVNLIYICSCPFAQIAFPYSPVCKHRWQSPLAFISSAKDIDLFSATFHIVLHLTGGSDSTPAFLISKDLSFSLVFCSQSMRPNVFWPKFPSLMSQPITFILTINLILIVSWSFPRSSSASKMMLWSSSVLMMPPILVILVDLIDTILNPESCLSMSVHACECVYMLVCLYT